ncbi:putative membrane protein YfhO [Streptococcus rupicaprae]|uniref:Membrane protein YfhO n=1 Tax=Streptococcus rupicaprae TaxID=759619 RepID=A0ABV2FEP9_9STRE
MTIFRKSYQKLGVLLRSKGGIYALSFLLPCLIMLGVWAFNGHFPFGSKSLMAVDFGQQYIGFYAYLKETLLSGQWGSFFHSFEKSIGGEMIGVLGYYLMSPFNIFYIILPLSQFKWAVFLTLLLRYGFMGLSFAHLLVKRYRGESQGAYVPIFATAYALSGMIVSYQMNPIFYDAMIWLPLLITYLEEALDQKRPYKYILILGVTVFTQFYMGYMICLFVALYACYYMAPSLDLPSWKERVRGFFLPLIKVLCYSLLAAGTTAVLLYPIVLNLLRSKGAYDNPLSFSFAFQINPLDILSKLVIGGFDNQSWSAGPSLPNLFVGALGLVGFILYFNYSQAHKYRKIAAAILSGLFLLSFVNEFTSKIWHMGQNPAGFFFRFSWLVSFFMVLLAFQTLQSKKQIKPQTAWTGLVLALVAITYLVYQDYTYISLTQPAGLTQLVTEHPKAVYVIFSGLILCFGAYVYRLGRQDKVWKQLLRFVLTLLGLNIAMVLLFKGYLLSQLVLTLITWLLALWFYSKPRLGRVGLLVVLVSGLELGYNAYLSQTTIGYTDAYKFSDLAVKLSQLSDRVEELNQETSQAPFYRIGTDFLYSKVDPLIGSFRGLSNFSSSMEKSTIDLFGALGDVGGNASTFYANGTALTDAFYSVRYYVARKDYTHEDVENNPKSHYFSKHSTRKDLQSLFEKIDEDETFVYYENPNVLPIAFATNQLTRNIQFGLNNPVSNQNIILNSMSNQDKDFFQHLAFNHIDLENMVYSEENGKKTYRRIDKSQMGKVTFRFTPQTDFTYYFQAPVSLRSSMGKMNILLNDQWYNYTQSFDQVQLWNIGHDAQGQEIRLRFETSTEDELDFTNFSLVRVDNKEVQPVLADRLQQGLRVTSFTDTHIRGEVTVTDDSDVMMTSIAYNPGWQVKVDGKLVETTEAWNSLLSFPISSGEHEIEMIFVTPGLRVGFLLSLMSIVVIGGLYWRDTARHKPSV